jgi:acyl-CoA reductase-like NAD-dependent aldehyde dehydrogenase
MKRTPFEVRSARSVWPSAHGAAAAHPCGVRAFAVESPVVFAGGKVVVALSVHQEPLGLLARIPSVHNLDEAITRVNVLVLEPATYAVAQFASRMNRLADGIEAGNLSLNHRVASLGETPLVCITESGYGRKGRTKVLDRYTVPKNPHPGCAWQERTGPS